MGEHLTVSQRGPVATVTMARPEVHNAFNEALIAELHATFQELSADDAVRVIVLAGDGKSFSAGADLDWMRRMASASEADNRADAQRLAAMLRAVSECPKPVVARVQRAAIGGGAGLAAAADIAIAAESAMFAFSEVRLGLAPATIAPHVIEKIGLGRALPLFLTGERFDAACAERIGLVHRAVADAELDATVASTVEALLAGSPAAQASIKTLVRRVTRLMGQGPSPDAAVDAYTSELISAIRASAEGREGVAAFLEKRQPAWATNVETSRWDVSSRRDVSGGRE
ncbi:MAG TPA: enoyl-CoA hydratase-related protein [Dehalococcoidia bacterium]|jgi:methylglutaconyl-CoA hydratase